MKLNQIPKRNIFKIPQDYFDELPLKIQNRITKRDSNQETSLYWKYAVVSIALLLFIISTLILNQKPTYDFNQVLSDSDTNELLIYIESNNIESVEKLDLSDEFYEKIILESLNMDLEILEEQLDNNDFEYIINEDIEGYI